MKRLFVETYGWPLFRNPRTSIGHSIGCRWFAVVPLTLVTFLPGSAFGFSSMALRIQAGSENNTMSGMEEVLSGEGGIRKTRFRFDQEYEIVVKQGDIAQERADGVIVPLNTAFAVGGSSASVFYAVDQARSNAGGVSKNIYELLFPLLNIPHPIQLSPGQVVIDLEDRPKASEKGAAVISESIRAAGIVLQQGWNRIIIAFIRDQGEDLSEEDITTATRNAVAEAERNQLESVVAVPFGAGILGIPAEKSASLMVPTVLEYWRSKKPLYPKKITFIMDLEGQYYQFAQATRFLVASFQKGGLEEQIQENFLQRQYEIQV